MASLFPPWAKGITDKVLTDFPTSHVHNGLAHYPPVFLYLNPNTCLFFLKKLVQVKDVIKAIWLLMLNMEIHQASHLCTPVMLLPPL